jgi:hypothetical protein
MLLLCPFVAGALWAGHGWLDVLTLPAAHRASLLLIAAAAAALACSWFGAYLAFALSLRCHDNEAGAAARIDRFCHFIRFKLEAERISGYVIGVRALADASSPLRPYLIEKFYVGEPPPG